MRTSTRFRVELLQESTANEEVRRQSEGFVGINQARVKGGMAAGNRRCGQHKRGQLQICHMHQVIGLQLPFYDDDRIIICYILVYES